VPAVPFAVELPGLPQSVSAARRLVVRTLREWDLDALEATAALLVTELATNAVLHARSDLRVQVERRGEVVRVGVSDASPAGPQRRRHGVEAPTGRGLGLVQLLAADWGTEACGQGSSWRKTVWFELPTDPRLLAEPAEGALLATG
jgi:anti-sigma regulatory factor (Ser/Thr protein kinase)